MEDWARGPVRPVSSPTPGDMTTHPLMSTAQSDSTIRTARHTLIHRHNKTGHAQQVYAKARIIINCNSHICLKGYV